MFKSKEELKEWIVSYLSDRGKRSLHTAINNSSTIKSSVLEYTDFLPEKTKINQRCYHIISDIIDIPLCKFCGINTVNFNNRDKNWRYLDYCSPKCGSSSIDVISKVKSATMLKWGVDNISKSKWYQQSDDFRMKSVASCLSKYGFSSYSKTKKFKDGLRKVFLEKYEVDWYSKSKEFRNKYRETCISRYGVYHPMLNQSFKKATSNTIRVKYDVDWYVQSNDFKLKSFDKKSKLYDGPAGFKYKEYILPSGMVVKVQGYENFALDILFKSYSESDVSISYYDIKDEIGILNYVMDDKDRIYLPDIYIKSENKIIEVKSEYIYNIEIEKNICKKEACILLGMQFEFWIMNKHGKLVNIF